jgi:RNA polymerase sigma-70 factor (ECF subfamily)
VHANAVAVDRNPFAALRAGVPPRPVSDLAVRRAQAGDDAAFAELYRAHAGRVYALCLRLEADAQRAEELTQDVFVRAWERLASYRGESAFTTWLHRLAVNVVLGDRRSAWRRAKRVFATADPTVYERADDLSPGTTLDLETAIGRLPAGARTVFVLHDVEGYTHEEIARMSDIAEGTSKAQLFRARRLLREALNR